MSLREIAALLNLDLSPDLFAEVFPVSATKTTYRFSNLKEATVQYITIEE